MNIKSLKDKVVLKIGLDGGIVDGKQKMINKSFSRIKTDVEDASLFTVGTLLSDLQEDELLEISKVETSILSEE